MKKKPTPFKKCVADLTSKEAMHLAAVCVSWMHDIHRLEFESLKLNVIKANKER